MQRHLGRSAPRPSLRILTAAALIGATGLAAAAPSTAGASQSGFSVSIMDFSFNPTLVTVPAGTRVTWTNSGRLAHTVTSRGDAWDPVRLNPDETFSVTFSTPGFYTYGCTLHPTMQGNIMVEPEPTPIPALSPAPQSVLRSPASATAATNAAPAPAPASTTAPPPAALEATDPAVALPHAGVGGLAGEPGTRTAIAAIAMLAGLLLSAAGLRRAAQRARIRR